MIRSFARTAVGAAAFAAIAVMTGPPANAQVLAVEVFAGPTGLLTGCPATVRTAVSDDVVAPGTVFFVLSGGVIPGNGERIPGEGVFNPAEKTVTITWTPTRIGSQNVVAIQSVPGQYTSSMYITVDVTGTGLDTGSSCQRLP